MDKQTIVLEDRCRFYLGDAPDAWQSWYDDGEWEEIRLPHDWSVRLPFSREYSSGTGYLAGGMGWYRLRIAPREEWRGKRLTLTFDGVYKNSRVWCNSYYLGERPSGFSSFSYDVTEQFRFDKDNVIAVRVDHREITDSRWFTGSGIVRKVSLAVEEPVRPTEYGIFFQTPEVSEEAAKLLVENELVNQSGQAAHVVVKNLLLTPEGETAAQAVGELELENGQTGRVDNRMELLRPRLWSCDVPRLYTLQTTISYTLADGSRADSVADVRRVGIRSLRFDPDEGLFLNGQPAVMKGVCVHDDAGCLGTAVLPAVWRRRLLKLKEMGCNAVRMSHNPHMPELYDLCDEMGFLVIDEAFDEWEAGKNKWWQGLNIYPPRNEGYFVDFPQWHRRDLTDLIRRDRNHPSILLWSIGNEIDYPNDPYCHPSFPEMTGNNDANKPPQERQYNPDRPNAERMQALAVRLAAIVRESDLTRPVTLAAAFPELSSRVGLLDPLDVAGYNYKEQFYEESHRRFPALPFIGSENGHSLEAWRAVTDKAYISGQFLWTGIDYLGEAGVWPIHGSGSGLLTLAGFEKPGYYRRQSFWSERPVLHLTAMPACKEDDEFAQVSEGWNYPLGEKVRVKCYTNLPEAAFYLNGESLGVYKKETDADCIHLTVPFSPGVLEAREVRVEKKETTEDGSLVSGAAPGESASLKERSRSAVSDRLETTGCACQIRLSCWDAENAARDGIYQIEAELQDFAGRRVYSDSTRLTVQVENGRLLGLENGDLSDFTDYASPSRRAFRGQLLIYAAPGEQGKAPKVTVSGEGVKTAELEL